jgi:hypothetical protein
VLALACRMRSMSSECENARRRVCSRAQRVPDCAFVDVMASVLAECVKRNRRLGPGTCADALELGSVADQVRRSGAHVGTKLGSIHAISAGDRMSPLRSAGQMEKATA